MRVADIQLISSGDFVPAVMIYRRACAMATQARNRATAHESTGGGERRLREIDATVETLILAQAAAEGWIHAAYRVAAVEPPHASWVQRWQQAPERLCGPGTRVLDSTTVATLRWLSMWRNYLVHDDAVARARLHEHVAVGTEAAQLTADLAEEVIARCDAAFADAGACFGARTLAGLNSAFLWRALDEA